MTTTDQPAPPATATSARRLLPMWGKTHGNRSATVCHYKCGDACAKPAPNTTDTSYFPDVVAQTISRRGVLTGSLALAGGAAFAGATVAPAAAAGGSSGSADALVPGHSFDAVRTIRFRPIDPVPNTVDAVTVPDGWSWRPVISWGDPVLDDAPGFDPDRVTAARQRRQFGYNNDYLTIIPTGRSRRGTEHALLVANHEYYNGNLMFADWDTEATPEKRLANLEAARMSMGLSVVALQRDRDERAWQPSRRRSRNVRITPTTRFDVDGPAAGSSLLATSADPSGRRLRGTANNCAGGTTPWGTVLSGEENFNQYFRKRAVPTAEELRYGLTDPAGSEWWRLESRFDLEQEPNEANRFGWIIEVDPFDPDAAPVKHTALGRFKHEGATIRLTDDGHVVAYMGDDERFDYVYKFVSAGRYDDRGNRRAREANTRLLSEGNLYVAQFMGDGLSDGDFDGTGEWLPLVEDRQSRVPGMSVEQVLVYTRLAADKLSPTKMDRPEDVEPSPRTGRVYIACTNNTRRTAAQVDEANPRPANKDGHVVELVERRNDPTGTRFFWNLILVCGDPADPTIPTYFGGYTGPVSPISCPDNVAFDGAGQLWISTDGQPDAIGYNDALHRVRTGGPNRGQVQQFLAVPTGAETCGPVIDSDDDSVFVAVQHPGDTEAATYDSPGSAFPYLNDGFAGPRPAVIQVFREE